MDLKVCMTLSWKVFFVNPLVKLISSFLPIHLMLHVLYIHHNAGAGYKEVTIATMDLQLCLEIFLPRK